MGLSGHAELYHPEYIIMGLSGHAELYHPEYIIMGLSGHAELYHPALNQTELEILNYWP